MALNRKRTGTLFVARGAELFGGHIMAPHPLRTAPNRERRNRCNDGWAHSSLPTTPASMQTRVVSSAPRRRPATAMAARRRLQAAPRSTPGSQRESPLLNVRDDGGSRGRGDGGGGGDGSDGGDFGDGGDGGGGRRGRRGDLAVRWAKRGPRGVRRQLKLGSHHHSKRPAALTRRR